MVSSIVVEYKQFNLTVIYLYTLKLLTSFIWPVEGTLTGITTPSLSGPGRIDIEIFDVISKTQVWEASSSSVEIQSAYYIALADWAACIRIALALNNPRRSRYHEMVRFYSFEFTGKKFKHFFV